MWITLSHSEFGDLYFVLTARRSRDIVDDSFQIGSISKTFPGTAMLLLEERGQLSLNDMVTSLVPDLADQFAQYAN